MVELSGKQWFEHEDGVRFRAALEDHQKLTTTMWALFASNITCGLITFAHPLMILGVNLVLGLILLHFKMRALKALIAASKQMQRWESRYWLKGGG